VRGVVLCLCCVVFVLCCVCVVLCCVTSSGRGEEREPYSSQYSAPALTHNPPYWLASHLFPKNSINIPEQTKIASSSSTHFAVAMQ
jgi:hypothetical protein